MGFLMHLKISFFLLALVSVASSLELKIELDADSIEFPQWVSGTIRVKINESRTRTVSVEESQPEFFLAQDTAIKFSKVIDFGPDSVVTLEPGESAIWCFMAEIPERYVHSRPKGPHQFSLAMRQFGAEAKSVPFTLWLPGKLAAKDLELASMKNLASQMSEEELNGLNEETKRTSFSGKLKGNVDPRVLFWKYRLRNAAYMKDLKQMPVCENCFRMPATLYWSNLLWDWCGMFDWDTPRCTENEGRLHAMLVSRLGKMVEAPAKAGSRPVLHTEKGKFVVSKRQMEMMRGGGVRK
jgi:hypothetical protein